MQLPPPDHIKETPNTGVQQHTSDHTVNASWCYRKWTSDSVHWAPVQHESSAWLDQLSLWSSGPSKLASSFGPWTSIALWKQHLIFIPLCLNHWVTLSLHLYQLSALAFSMVSLNPFLKPFCNLCIFVQCNVKININN
jgi:hypothetical protein